jgi:hypothetical protein
MKTGLINRLSAQVSAKVWGLVCRLLSVEFRKF